MTDCLTAYDDGDIDTNRSTGTHLNTLIDQRYSRRQAMWGGMQAASAAVFGGILLAGCNNDGPTIDNGGPLTVSAGSSGTTTAGMTVTLTGMVSGTGSVGLFTQTGGPTVTLTPVGNTATFTAPGVAASTVLTFTFTLPGSSPATVSVTVNPAVLGFTAVAKSLADVVAVPSGYSVTVLYRLGDPIASGVAAFANDGTDSNFAQRAGDHHDGMSWFGLAASGTAPDYFNNSRGVLVLNHENITQNYLHPAGPTSPGGVRPEAEARKEIECHGVSVIETVRTGTAWSYVQASALNRRITPFTTMSFSGPVRGNAGLRTAFSTDGTAGRGTINNCANGTMPWNTYLTNEENWAGYFRRNTGDAATRTAAGAAKQNTSLTRYGIPEGRTGNYGWSTVVPTSGTETGFARWNITANAAGSATTDFRNEAFQFGWVVEIDPFDPTAAPRKRTALGRMNHEGCEIGRTIAGVRPAFYMGDDAQNEYIYKFVSATPWSAADFNVATNRLAIGDKYLDAGTLYVARFNADGSGQWLPLVFGTGPLTAANAAYSFADQADVLINARLAGDALGATRMDRPEWTAVNPATGEMYCTLTNNSSRTAANTDAANPRAYTDPRTTGGSTSGNANGHIIRLRETGDTSEATSFTWDVYAFGAGSDLDATNINISGLDATNDFSSPDGLWFGRAANPTGAGAPLLWVETDDGAFVDQTNCMLLAAIPGTVGDGGTKTVTNTIGGNSSQTTRIGKLPGTTLRRFLVGPKECEITGITSTADGRAIFVNIQHPGENGSPAAISSSWPANQSGAVSTPQRPRSSTIVITKNDGGIVGL